MTASLKSLYGHWELLWSITSRELRVRYKQSLLGASWAILQPLSLMLLFTLVFSKFAKVPSDGIPYPIFAYTALLPWTFFSTSISSASPSIVNNSGLLTKVRLPCEVFPLASILAAFVDFGIGLLVLFVMMLVYHVTLSLSALYIFPLLIIQLVLTLGFALFSSAINVAYRDVKYAVPLILQLWLFATPVAYPVSLVPLSYRWLYLLNPMAPVIDGYRKTLLLGSGPDFQFLMIAFIFSLVLVITAYIYFKNRERDFADIV